MHHIQTFIPALKKSSGNGRSKRQNEKFITSSRIIFLELVMKIWLQATLLSFLTGRQTT
jgi:hypothetical protein